METSVHNVLGNLCKYSPITCFYLLNLLGGPTDEIDLVRPQSSVHVRDTAG